MSVKSLALVLVKIGYQKEASDIYIFPQKNYYLISYRVQEVEKFKKISLMQGQKIIHYFKYLANMDVSERRKPQSGAAKIKFKKSYWLLRFSTIGDFQQKESMVIRLLNHFNKKKIHNSYFFPNQLHLLEENMQHRKGLFVFSGPVGSGKTTSMYQIANQLAEKKQVITIEDPVELNYSRFLQIQVNEKAQLTYTEILKACLRHRPDILIIGEIRDSETANLAVRAALTGHTVLATLHAKSTYGVINRLLDLGISSTLLQQCISGIVFQRLLPKYCPFCEGSCQQYCRYFFRTDQKSLIT